MKLLYIIVLSALMSACTNPKDAKKALESMGFTDIKITNYKWLACSDQDFYHTGFIATNVQGKQVTGTVCSGIFFRNSTVRFS